VSRKSSLLGLSRTLQGDLDEESPHRRHGLRPGCYIKALCLSVGGFPEIKPIRRTTDSVYFVQSSAGSESVGLTRSAVEYAIHVRTWVFIRLVDIRWHQIPLYPHFSLPPRIQLAHSGLLESFEVAFFDYSASKLPVDPLSFPRLHTLTVRTHSRGAQTALHKMAMWSLPAL
jgi:hypothetical protein